MANVKVFKCNGGHVIWQMISDLLNVTVYREISDADISIVLSGRFENPLAFTGKKILAYDAYEWLKILPLPIGFNAYKVVLDAYYDDYINLTGLRVKDRVKKIEEYIQGV